MQMSTLINIQILTAYFTPRSTVESSSLRYVGRLDMATVGAVCIGNVSMEIT